MNLIKLACAVGALLACTPNPALMISKYLDAASNWTFIGEAPWSPRDSSGHAVFDHRLWVLGGWESSEKESPRDVWSSPDGITWDLATSTAPWTHSDFPMTVAHGGYLWSMGGWENGRLPTSSASNAVWRTKDGKDWTLVNEHAGWSPRLAAGIVSFKGKIWVLGGLENYLYGDPDDLKNDVWSSVDGKVWTREVKNAPWAPRAFHAAIVHNGRIWIMGGGNYEPIYVAYNDVWSSADGKSWRKEGVAPWGPRLWFSAASYKGRIWVINGWAKEPDNYRDAWVSRDGKNWTKVPLPSKWRARHAAAIWVLNGHIYIGGGHARPLTNEIWRFSEHAVLGTQNGIAMPVGAAGNPFIFSDCQKADRYAAMANRCFGVSPLKVMFGRSLL